MNSLLEQVFMQVNMGIIAIDPQYRIVLCNHFISDFSRKSVDDLTDKCLFDAFPSLPKKLVAAVVLIVFLC